MIKKSENVINVLEKLADIDFQNDVWVQGKYWHRINDFGEAVNTLDDYEFFDDLKKNSIGLSKEELEKAINFIDKLLKYDIKDPKFMISDSNWKEIIYDTQTVLGFLKKHSW